MYLINLCGKDCLGKDRELHDLEYLFKQSLQDTADRETLQRKHKNYLKIQKLVLNVSNPNKVFDLREITGEGDYNFRP